MLLTEGISAAIGEVSRGPEHRVVALLIDDQFVIGQVMRDMLKSTRDIEFHFCQDPENAVTTAKKVAPTVILQDLSMPGIDGLSLLKQLRRDPGTRDIPIIIFSSKEQPLIKAQAFALGASDYLIKLPDRIELIARIRHHSRGYIAQLERNEAYRRLAESERLLAADMAQAAQHVQSLLPAPIKHGPIRIDWRFVPSTQLGGDAFGYQWLDSRHLALYLLDVSGHGVGASLLAVSVLNVLSHQTLTQTDFYDPASVMCGLNKVFTLDKHGGRFFTIWYGVASLEEKMLTFSGGGHPPALLLRRGADEAGQMLQLSTLGPPIGIVDGVQFKNGTAAIPNLGRLFLYTDGVVEVRKPGGKPLDQAAFTQFVTEIGTTEDILERVLDRGHRMRSSKTPTDDCSLLLIDFV